MLNLELHSKRSPEEVADSIISYFGTDGLGLKLTNDCMNQLTFVGGGGHVTASLCKDGEQTAVQLETREWEYPVQKFAKSKLFTLS
jgi:hypothetical protein